MILVSVKNYPPFHLKKIYSFDIFLYEKNNHSTPFTHMVFIKTATNEKGRAENHSFEIAT